MLAMVLLAATSSACTRFEAKTPKGFVVLKSGRNERIFVSPDNTLVAVRVWKNRPKGDVAFWAETLKRDFTKVRGYGFEREENVRAASGHRGRLLHFTGGYRGARYDYFLAVFVRGNRILTVEFVCRHERLGRYLPAFRHVLETLRLK